MKQLAIFDIDNTLTESRRAISPDMAKVLSALIDRMPVAIISGEALEDFKHQITDHLSHKRHESLYILPTSGAELYEWKDGGWKRAYSYPIKDEKRRKIFEELSKLLKIHMTDLGNYIYDRGSQITYTALGKNAALEEKYAWDPDHENRKKIVSMLKPLLPGVSMMIGGSTSIDFTEYGIDKAFGVSKLLNHLKIEAKDTIYIGDALDPGGNDAPVITLGVETKKTNSLNETKKIIETLLKS